MEKIHPVRPPTETRVHESVLDSTLTRTPEDRTVRMREDVESDSLRFTPVVVVFVVGSLRLKTTIEKWGTQHQRERA